MLSIIQAAGWPIWPLIFCSVLGLALIIERFVSLQEQKVVPPKLLSEAVTATRPHLPSAEVVQQLAQHSMLGKVLASGIEQLQRQPASSEEDLRQQMESTGRLAAAELQRYLGALATIASSAPLIGLLGTVIGMIEIFSSQSGNGGLSAGGGDPAQWARGISIALYNTAFGLMVAIPSLIFWRYFRARVDNYLLRMEVASAQFLHHLQGLRR